MTMRVIENFLIPEVLLAEQQIDLMTSRISALPDCWQSNPIDTRELDAIFSINLDGYRHPGS